MTFRELTRLRNALIEKRKREVMEVSLEDFGSLFVHKYGVVILRKLAEGDKTSGELVEHTHRKWQHMFLRKAKRLGIIERYYDKKRKDYYFRLIVREVRVFL